MTSITLRSLASALLLLPIGLEAQNSSRPLAPKSLQQPGAGGSGAGTIQALSKISNASPGFPDTLDVRDQFGASIAVLGDLDGDGIAEVAVGCPFDFPPGYDFAQFGSERGSVLILFLNSDGSVRKHNKIDRADPRFRTGPTQGTLFGSAIATLGDLNGDGVPDIVVSGGSSLSHPALWVLFLRADGTVLDQQKIAPGIGGFGGTLATFIEFGTSLASIGDLDGDGNPELAVGSQNDNDGGLERGALWVLFLNSDGTVKQEQKISQLAGGFSGLLDDEDHFGRALAGLGDLDGDGSADLVVSAIDDDDSGVNRGALWLLFMNPDASVKQTVKISADVGGLDASLGRTMKAEDVECVGDWDGDGVQDLVSIGFLGSVRFWVVLLNPDGSVKGQVVLKNAPAQGSALGVLGDLDGDGVQDLLVGDRLDPELGVSGSGAYFAMFHNITGSLKTRVKVSGIQGGLEGTLDSDEEFGSSIALLGDLDGDGVGDLAVGAPMDVDGFLGRPGAVWILFMHSDQTIKGWQKISRLEGWPSASIGAFSGFGQSLAPLGDLNGDGTCDLAVGGSGDSNASGALWILFLNPDGSVQASQQISSPAGTSSAQQFARNTLANLGDIDGDGVVDLGTSSPGTGLLDEPTVWILFLNSDGTLKGFEEISKTTTGLPTGTFNRFGNSVTCIGDLDGDGNRDLAVGEPNDSTAGGPQGAVWILFLNADGSLKDHQKISSLEGGFSGTLSSLSYWGAHLAGVGDLDGDGVEDLAVGDPRIFGSESGPGTIWMLFLNEDGTVKSHLEYPIDETGFPLNSSSDFVGTAIATLGDYDGDGLLDLAIGNSGDNDNGGNHGALWIASLDGVARFGFEMDDAQQPLPLANGQHLGLQGLERFTRAIRLSARGPNLGVSVFDSSPSGPNAPGPASDFLVGAGNLLMLQDLNASAQSTAGVFDTPRSSELGGVLRIDFTAPVEVLSLELVDVDAGASEAVRVRLFDIYGRRRTYQVPPDWTGELGNMTSTGRRRLQLDTLQAQAGFGSSVSASQDGGFNPQKTRAIEIRMGSTAAIDDLRWDPHP